MPRFFLSSSPAGENLSLTGPEMHHLLHVYRAQPGMNVTLFDALGTEYEALIIACEKKQVRLQIVSKRLPPPGTGLKIILAQGLLKSKCWDIVLQKSMELGVSELLPMVSDHLGDGADCAGRPERWQKIVIEAAKQCGRTALLQVSQPQKMSQILHRYAHLGAKFLAHNDLDLPLFRQVLDETGRQPEVVVLVGPEGGFSDRELEEAKTHGFRLFCLGNLTLRAETAALVVAANLQFYWGQLPLS